jgi:glyoxylate utilization-related uncharacterized protein
MRLLKICGYSEYGHNFRMNTGLEHILENTAIWIRNFVEHVGHDIGRRMYRYVLHTSTSRHVPCDVV